MIRSCLYIILFLLGSLLPNLLSAQQHAPNIIIILADDLGYADVGFNGCKDIPTPNIDRIAANGVTCTRGYVSYAVCGPSRAGLITGRYQDRFGFARNPLLAPNDLQMGLPLNQVTMADFLHGHHYVTGAIGKWHLGAHQLLRPNKRGFDEFFGFLSGGHKYLPEEWTLNDLSEAKAQYDGYKTKLLRNNTRVEENEYITDAFSREAVSFVERHRDKPFFLYLAYNAPHAPLEATEKYLKRFESIKNPKRRTYAAMVSAMDDGVGLLIDKLEQLKLDQQTLVFFLSDNGGPIHANGSNNSPLRGEKGDLFEGGIHVPFAVQWKGHLPAGITYDKPVISLDIFATAAGLLHAQPAHKLDGVNLIPFLTGKLSSSPHESLFWRHNTKSKGAIVEPQYKSIVEAGQQPMLFNLKKDISEKNNLAGEAASQSILSNLDEKLRVWNQWLIPPAFMGLLEDEEYSAKHPDRWKITDNR